MTNPSAVWNCWLRAAGKGMIILFCIPILSVWTAGSILCAGISLIAAILGAFGWEGVGVSLGPELMLPGWVSLPLGIVLAVLLIWSFSYTRRYLRSCIRFVKEPAPAQAMEK